MKLIAAERGIDLSPAMKLIGSDFERRRWLEEMLDVGGMSPGGSARAHARAFRFAAALGRLGYRVLEGPFGPRGGRRFLLESYGGPRAALLYGAIEHRSCTFEHGTEDCTCFRKFDVPQLELVLEVHRVANRGSAVRTSTNGIAAELIEHSEEILRSAMKLYGSRHSPVGMPSLHDLLGLLMRVGASAMSEALATFRPVDGTRLGGPSLEQHVVFGERWDARGRRGSGLPSSP